MKTKRIGIVFILIMISGHLLSGCAQKTVKGKKDKWSRYVASLNPELFTQGMDLSIPDVSFILPLPLQDNQTLRLQEGEEGPNLFTRNQFNQLKKVNNGMLTTTSMQGSPFNYDDYVITAFRFIPCEPHIFPESLDPKKCDMAAIRLVAQSYSADGDNPPPFFAARWGTPDPQRWFHDSALHLVYDVKDRDIPKILEGLIALKNLSNVSTKGKKIGLHPAMAVLDNPNSSGAEKEVALNFFQQFKKFVQSTISYKDLSLVTEMRGTRNGPEGLWNFEPHVVQKRKQLLLPDPVPGLITGDENDQALSFTKKAELPGFVERKIPRVIDNIINNGRLETISMAGKSERQKAVIRIYHHLNPQKLPINKGDCLSCHLAGHAKAKLETTNGLSPQEKALIKPFQFVNQTSEPGDLPEEVIGLKAKDPFQTLNFGRCSGGKTNKKLCISQRTLNETLHVLQFLNENRGP